jgi:hypothetical protein
MSIFCTCSCLDIGGRQCGADPYWRHCEPEPSAVSGELPPACRRMFRSRFSARRRRPWRARSHALSGARRVEPCRRLQGARHVDGGGVNDVACRCSTVLGARALLLSYHLDIPSGPAIVLVAGVAYLVSVTLGPRESLRALYIRRRHLRRDGSAPLASQQGFDRTAAAIDVQLANDVCRGRVSFSAGSSI